MKTLLLITVLLTNCGAAKAQEIFRPASGAYMAAEVYALSTINALAAVANPAALPWQKQHSGGIFAEHRFGLAELKFFEAAGTFKTNNGGFGLQLQYNGYSGSNVTNIAASYGRRLSSSISVGAGLHYLRFGQQAIYGNASSLTASLGFLVRPYERFTATFYTFNPFRVSWGREAGFRIPSLYRFGAGYQASDKLLLSAEMLKEEGFAVGVRAMVDYAILSSLRFKIGVASGSSSVIAGLAFQHKGFRVDVLTAYHQQLGFSPGSALLFPFGKPENPGAE